MKRIITTAVAAALSLPALAAEDNVTLFSQELANGWSVSSHVGEVSRKFSHCTASTMFAPKTAEQKRKLRASSATMIVKLGENGMAFSLVAPEWKLTPGKKYNIGFNFDGKVPFSIDATAEEKNILAVYFSVDADWYRAMALAHGVTLSIAGQEIGGFNLKGSGVAMKELAGCAKAFFDQKQEDPSFGGGAEQKEPNAKSYDMSDDTF